MRLTPNCNFKKISVFDCGTKQLGAAACPLNQLELVVEMAHVLSFVEKLVKNTRSKHGDLTTEQWEKHSDDQNEIKMVNMPNLTHPHVWCRMFV
jgi:hypothetical protein